MRKVTIDRRLLAGDDKGLPGSRAVRALDQLGLPDGFPFLIEDDGSFAAVWSANQYLIEAFKQGAYPLSSLRNAHVYHLWRLLRFIRVMDVTATTGLSGAEAEAWIVAHGEPQVDLTEVTREDLVAYRDARCAEVTSSTWNNELGHISGFYDWAVTAGLMERSPIPRWGQRGRNTLAVRERLTRDPRFLTVPQLRLFLKVGLRCDGSEEPSLWRERNYSYGLVLATMGLRREEAAFLLDCEVPDTDTMPSNGVWPFLLVGKGERPRTVYATEELVSGLDLYRRTERQTIVERSQKSLREALRSGDLVVCQKVLPGKDGIPVVLVDGRRIRADRLDDQQRSTAVTVTDRGLIEPLGLFLGEGGLPMGLRSWNKVFEEARHRVAQSDSPDRPPGYLTVTPHVFRHTYAVRMLSALMREGRERAKDPYLLLANPVLTVMELLGHANVSTTQRYLYAAERYSDELPSALRAVSATTLGSLASEEGAR